MKHQKLNNNTTYTGGFSTVELVISVAVLGVIALVGLVVANHRNSSTAANLAKSNSTSSSTSNLPQPSTSNPSTLSTTAPASTSSSSGKPPTTKSSGTSSAKSSSSTGPATPTETPLSAITAVITGLDNGQNIEVTANTVTIPGPIRDATGRPIVYTVNGQTYFAYRQKQAINFNQSPAQAAETLATVVATVNNPPLITAHLDKLGNLVDENFVVVGFSTGGD